MVEDGKGAGGAIGGGGGAVLGIWRSEESIRGGGSFNLENIFDLNVG